MDTTSRYIIKQERSYPKGVIKILFGEHITSRLIKNRIENSPSAETMQYAFDFSRPDRLLFGSDHPWVKIAEILEHFNRLRMPEVDRRRILGENACRLFRIE